jgi:hypothetical protein
MSVPPVRGSRMYDTWPVGETPAQRIGEELVKIDVAAHKLDQGEGRISDHKEEIEGALDKIYIHISELPHPQKDGARTLYDSLKAEVSMIFKEGSRKTEMSGVRSLFDTIEDFHRHIGY